MGELAAVGIAAFGAPVPASGALGHGCGADYVAGLHHALLAGAVLAAVGAVCAAWLLGVPLPVRSRGERTVAQPVTDAA